MACEMWIRLQRRAEEATYNFLRQQKSLPQHEPTPKQAANTQALQDAVFHAIAAIQQHEKEHRCHLSAKPVSDSVQGKLGQPHQAAPLDPNSESD
jgi:hypothetical protein